MKYFLLKQDKRYTDAPELHNIHQKVKVHHFNQDESHLFPIRTVVNIKPSMHIDFTDYLYQSVPLFSDKALKAIQLFDNDFIYKQIILFDPDNAWDCLYHIPFFPRFSYDILTPSAAFDNGINEDCKEPIILKMPYTLPAFYVFRQNQCLPFIRIDLAESLLRNGARGFILIDAISAKES